MTTPEARTPPHDPRAGIAPVEKAISVPWPMAEAFDRFTRGIAGWWPLQPHSIGGEDAETCVFEGRVDGRIYEISRDGTRHPWGTVTVWQPPRRVAFTWHPGRPVDTRQEVEVRFSPEGTGTRVELTHTGWERLGEDASRSREIYDSGWDTVLARYAG